MKYTITKLTFASFLVIAANASGQTEDQQLSRDFAEYFESVRAKTALPHTISDDTLRAHSDKALELLRPYEQDASPRVRYFAYVYGWRIGLLSHDAAIRREVTRRLLAACSDPDGLVWQHAADWLLSFNAEDFSEDSKDVIRQFVAEEKPRPVFVRLVGTADIRDALPRLQELLIDEAEFESGPHAGKWYGTVGWAARLVRARFGVQEDLQRAIELVEHEGNEVVRISDFWEIWPLHVRRKPWK